MTLNSHETVILTKVRIQKSNNDESSLVILAYFLGLFKNKIIYIINIFVKMTNFLYILLLSWHTSLF